MFITIAAAAFISFNVMFISMPSLSSPPGNKDVTATLFQWSFLSVAKECTEVLGPKGYGWVEISPAQEHISGSEWWTSYQPINYSIGNRLGSRREFKKMIDKCHRAGVKVMADAVINHMSSGLRSDGMGFSKYHYPGLYEEDHFHTSRYSIDNDYHDRSKVQNGELVGLADLKTEDEYVRNTIAAYLNDLISLGVDGFRIDAAKHIYSADLRAIKAKLTSSEIFWVSEAIYGDNEAVHPKEYTDFSDVDEFLYGRELKRMFEKQQLANLASFGEVWGFLPSHQARSFVDNWDTERNGSTLSYKNGALYTLANVFMLAWPYGAPNIFSGYEFSDHDAGAPNGGIVKACFEDGWKCQHKWPQIINMVAFRQAAADTKVTNWWSNGNNAIAFGRGDKAFVVINRESHPIKENFQTSLPAGKYCDVQHGEIIAHACSGKVYEVNSLGQFNATINGLDAIALYVD